MPKTASIRLIRLTVTSLLCTLLPSTALRAQEESNSFTNLQLLPKDISRDDLFKAMLRNLRGLGLPRRQNEGCLFCHVGDMEQSVDTWDFASDDKPTKRKARRMMAMVAAINEEYMAGLENRVAPSFEVTCYTCHAGRTDPRTLPDLLLAAYRTGGINSAVTKYRALRDRYFGADAYDFRVGVLAAVAHQIAATGAFDDAITLARLEDEFYPDEPRARRAVLLLELRRTTQQRGVTAALEEFDQARVSEEADVIAPGLLDGLGWGLWRADRQEDALMLFRKNLAVFPDEYIPNESLADALWFSGERATAIQMFEDWLERHPDHAMARRRLTNLKSQAG